MEIRLLQRQLCEDSVLHIHVRRDCLLLDAMKEATKKKFDPKKRLRVRIIEVYHLVC